MKKRWMALLGAAVVTINLFAGCGSTGAEQTGNNADGTATEAVQGKDSAGGGNTAQSVAGYGHRGDESFVGAGGGI